MYRVTLPHHERETRMRANINGIDIEGTPAEIVEYLTAATQSATNGYVKPEPEHRPYPLPPEPEPEPEPKRVRIFVKPKPKAVLDVIAEFPEGIPAAGIYSLMDGVTASAVAGRIQALHKQGLIELIPRTLLWRTSEKARNAEIIVF